MSLLRSVYFSNKLTYLDLLLGNGIAEGLSTPWRPRLLVVLFVENIFPLCRTGNNGMLREKEGEGR